MRVAVVSDIHGNTAGLRAVLRALDRLGGADRLVAAGDAVTGGAGAGELLRLLSDSGAELLLGNAEAYLADPAACEALVSPRFRKYMKAWRGWLREHLDEAEWLSLTQSPPARRYEFANGRTMLVCHAAPGDPWAKCCAAQTPDAALRAAYGGCGEDVICYGPYHSHHVMPFGGKLLVNAASVGLRRDGYSCLTLVEDAGERLAVRQHTVAYDAEEEERLLREAGAPVFGELVE